jgi:hypothetical protein
MKPRSRSGHLPAEVYPCCAARFAVALLALPALARGHADFAYVLVRGDGQTMSGSTSDLREASRLAREVQEKMQALLDDALRRGLARPLD